MGYYILKRLVMTVLVIFVAMLFLGSLSHIVPGDPVKLMLGPRAKADMIERVRSEMELDKPVVVQVFHFALNALQGDLGKDFRNNTPVTRLIGSVLPHTIYLAVFSLLLASLIGIPLGVFSAFRPNSWIDRVTSIFSVSLITMPTFVAALLMLMLFAVELRWLPAIGVGDPSDPLDYFKHLILPAVAMAVTWIGYLARLVRASTLEILNANYVRTAYAYGLSERLISYKYALKNSLIPTVAVLGVGLGNLLGGAIFVEVIFARPGLGYLLYQAEMTRNYPIVRGGTLVVALLFVFANLLADLSYHYLDPRIKIAKLDL